ncbi:MAG: AAA family ATPase [Cytophagales bacterium CG12_big_fil_rev_8_21_14_0_65_40_12]|nr:MAG: AAA family ATPase [Cytophagales bacterium CG12_big_fil_rev_8_21_14_0_65_40_12]PIW03032.1 MAG: AAA family ATPase [Cytophagales bacterium CG17_big_fil_post_rev_8_21_14_2_50_40_13]
MELNSTFVKIDRQAAPKVRSLAQSFKAVVITGPRQSGKTTLAKTCFDEKPYVSLENPDTRNFAIEDPRAFLNQYNEGAILDEIQRASHLLSYLQQILDESAARGRFILTGSNNLQLLESVSQSLAGRTGHIHLLPLSIEELKQVPNATSDLNTLLWKGQYPSIQAEFIPPTDWLPSYISTYVERDVRQIKGIENLLLFERFLSLCAGRAGQRVNYNNLAIETGVDNKTIKAWLSVLEASYVIFQLPPYYKNFNKRVVKSPKLYFYDTGLLCNLLRISTPELLAQHPYRGAIFENFVILEAMKNRFNQGQPSNLYYWLDNSGNEIDLLIDNGLNIEAIEIKSGITVNSEYFKNLHFWKKITGQSNGCVIYGGTENQNRSDGFKVTSWLNLGEL